MSCFLSLKQIGSNEIEPVELEQSSLSIDCGSPIYRKTFKVHLILWLFILPEWLLFLAIRVLIWDDIFFTQNSRVEIAASPLEVNSSASPPPKRRGSYTYLDDETRAKIGRYAFEHGRTKAASHYTNELKLQKPLSHSSAIRFRDLYLKSLRQNRTTEIKAIPREKMVRHVKLPS